jgi:hypothetical protein
MISTTKAISLDPEFAEAYAWLAMTHHFGYMYCGEPTEEHRPLARSLAQQAVSLESDNASAHVILGYVRAYNGELLEGMAELEVPNVNVLLGTWGGGEGFNEPVYITQIWERSACT